MGKLFKSIFSFFSKKSPLPDKRLPAEEASVLLGTDPDKWDLEYNELNELRFGAIRTLEEYCWYPGTMCIQCKMLKGCKLFFIHDAIKKTGIREKTWYAMRDWSTRYYRRNERS